MKEFGSEKNILQNDSFKTLDNFPLYGFCMCIGSAFMGRSTPTTAFDGAIWYFAYTIKTQ